MRCLYLNNTIIKNVILLHRFNFLINDIYPLMRIKILHDFIEIDKILFSYSNVNLMFLKIYDKINDDYTFLLS